VAAATVIGVVYDSRVVGMMPGVKVEEGVGVREGVHDTDGVEVPPTYVTTSVNVPAANPYTCT